MTTAGVCGDTAATGGWVENKVSSSPTNNGCGVQPCGHREVCVPTSSTSVPTSSQSTSHVCLPLPSQCGKPDTVPHGDVIVSASGQNDVARVKCDERYVASPKNVSVEIVCLVSIFMWSNCLLDLGTDFLVGNIPRMSTCSGYRT